MKKVSDPVLRAARAQAAIVRTLATEVERGGQRDEETEGLHAQAIEESARLVSAVESLSKARSSAHFAHSHVSPPVLENGERRWPRILIVEDDEPTRSAIARGLAPEYDVVAVGDGAAALTAASEIAFDAVVADMGMPEMDGITMVEHLRQAHPALPVVFLTGETTPERVAAGFSAGGTAYLVKPVDLTLLDQELRWVLGSSNEANRPS